MDRQLTNKVKGPPTIIGDRTLLSAIRFFFEGVKILSYHIRVKKERGEKILVRGNKKEQKRKRHSRKISKTWFVNERKNRDFDKQVLLFLFFLVFSIFFFFGSFLSDLYIRLENIFFLVLR